tara:strand:+ start:3922 stop:4248 length:327 start_codon:yes stop_codon:yes gene_type:complete
MEFTVKKDKEQSIKLDRRQLLDLLFGRVLSVEREDFVGICSEFSEYIQEKRMLGQMSLNHLLTIAFATGYYYRIFLEKNEVDITDSKGEKIELVNQDSDKPTGKGFDG